MKIKQAKNILISCLVCFPAFVFCQSKTSSKPNIIFILADDLGSAELGSYGNKFNETPNLDKLASQGLKFNQAYAAASVCSPTRASIMTGQYPARVRITDFLPAKTTRLLDPAKYTTLNNPLQAAGYQTGIIGKWHLDTDFKNNIGGPDKHGFNEVIGTETKYIADGDYFYPYDKINTYTSGKPDEYLTDRQCADAVDFIGRNKQKPFFLYLSFYSVHTALDAPAEIIGKYKRKYDTMHGAGSAEKVFGPENVKHTSNKKYNPYLAAMLEQIDKGVGSLMDKLEEEGLAKNTLIVFFSDNGGAKGTGNNGNLREGKTWLYEGGIRENLIMRWPDKIKAGTETDFPVSSIDFYPTFLGMAGAKQPVNQKIDGINILPLMTKGAKPVRDELYWHNPSETGKAANKMSSVVRKGNYKLFQFYQGNRLELYNLESDSSERTNLADTNPVKREELLKLLEKWKRDVDAEIPDLVNAKTVN
ncbi:sulfatase [Daejeonella sp.]|uniref:sulfatase n=1 Tax=Daejeonella sp. TaxID=2805397 RepID=UPI0030BD502A